jgi:lipopolysaccharide/colanic/teichoic acid biosynthesis glycosyltransferase
MTNVGSEYRGKRVLDVTIALAGLVLTAPVMVIAAIAVRVSSPGPVLHRAVRISRGGGTYTLLKFRSMVHDATASGPGVTAAHDPRITAVGRVLRHWKVDELPQLWNVVRGEMSVVGPRPEDPRYLPLYPSELVAVLAWRPGITSPASVAFRHEERLLAVPGDVEETYRNVLIEKLELDLAYMRRASLRTDLRVLRDTVAAVRS